MYLTLFIIAFTAKAIMDLLAHKYSQTIFAGYNRQFWNPAVSHRNKYKAGAKQFGPRFPGSTTWAVFLSDAWHLFQALFLLTLPLAAYLSPTLWHLVIGLTLGKSWFEVCYRWLLIKSFWKK